MQQIRKLFHEEEPGQTSKEYYYYDFERLVEQVVNSLEEARQVASQIKDHSFRCRAFVKLIELTQDEKYIKEARQAAWQANDDDRPFLGVSYERYGAVLAWAAVYRISKSDEDIEQAREIAKNMSSAYFRAHAYVSIGRETSDSSDIEAARDAAGQVEHPEIYDEAWVELARITRDKGDIEQSRQAATNISDPWHRTLVFIRISKITNEDRDVDSAKIAANQISKGWLQEKAMDEIFNAPHSRR